MEVIKEWKEIATKSIERLEYLEQGILELERKIRKRLWDCQGMNEDEGGKLANAYLLLDMRDLGNMIDGVKRAKHEEGPSRTKFNTENAPDVFYIQNLKKKPIETFREYATCWRSEAAKVRLALEEEQMNKFFVRAQDPQYYERLMVIENHKFSDIIKLGEGIEEGIKSGMVTNFEALQATHKASQSGAQLYERLKAAGYITPIPTVAVENPSQWINPNKTYAYHSSIKGHTIEKCRMLKDKIQTLIDTKVIQAKEATPNIHNNPLPDHRGEGVNVIETDEEWDQEGSIRLIREGDTPKLSLVTLTPVVVQTQEPFDVEVAIPFIVMVAPTPSYEPDAILWDYVAEARKKGKAKMEETDAAQDAYKNALIKVLSEAYVPAGITNGEMANIVGQVLGSHKITFHEDDLPPAGLSQNKALHITVKFEDKFIARVLIDGGSSLKICPLTTLKRLGKCLHEIRMGSMNMKAFDGSQRATIGEINLDLQMGMTWFDVGFQLLDISATYNQLLGRPWIHAARAVASTLHQVVKFEWNHQEVFIHGDRSNPIFTNQTIPVIENRRKLGRETYHRIEWVNTIEKDQWWSKKIESILLWTGY
ncbi:uncharacterized protein [Nicotiana tomentosiformis]|uniref:uncharacterized protein n=1 Tax=Nicotiana tomentosiformis TaxID=4098 RepID=UPI00388C55D2